MLTSRTNAWPRSAALVLQEEAVGNVVILIFAILLCLVNAAVWTLISEMPLMGAAWVLAAFACLFMQKWTRG